MANRLFRVHKISFPEYVEYDKRVKSFEPASEGSYIHDNAKKLAAAGFFYTGNEDETLCFYCGGGVKAWKTEDVPWVEHAKWLSGCSFLIVNKGFDFIRKHEERSDSTGGCVEEVRKVPQETGRIDLQCVICLTYEKNVFFLPCRHCCVCSECSSKLSQCVVCREDIVSQMEIFIA